MPWEIPVSRRVIDDLKRHKTVEAIFRQSGRELHYRFSLSNTDAAIGYVEEKCGALGQT